MRLRLRFEVDAGVMQSKGEALLELKFSVKRGHASVKVSDIQISSDSSVLDVGSRVLSLPLRQLLARQLGEALNQIILDLPQQEPRLKKIDLIEIQD